MRQGGSFSWDRLFGDTVIVALMTALAYWIAAMYEVAYLKAYGFPPHLAEVSLQSTVIVAMILYGAFLFLFMLANLIAMLQPQDPVVATKFARIFLCLIVPTWVFVNYGVGFKKEQAIAYFFIGYIVIFEILWPRIVYRNEKTWRERFLADEMAEEAPL
jgi:hypothetical protein